MLSFSQPQRPTEMQRPLSENFDVRTDDVHIRSGTTLFMESWPALRIDRPEDTNPGYPAPHVVACAHAGVVVELQRPDVDMVVWGRKVPKVWKICLNNWSGTAPPIDLSGTPAEISDFLASSVVHQEWPEFILSDVMDMSSLLGALTGGARQRIRLRVLTTSDVTFEQAPGALRLICGYGCTGAEWCNSQDPQTGVISLLPAFAVALIKRGLEDDTRCLHRLPSIATDDTMQRAILVMDTVSG